MLCAGYVNSHRHPLLPIFTYIRHILTDYITAEIGLRSAVPVESGQGGAIAETKSRRGGGMVEGGRWSFFSDRCLRNGIQCAGLKIGHV